MSTTDEKKGLFWKYWGKKEDEFSEEDERIALDDLKMEFISSHNDALKKRNAVEKSMVEMCKDNFKNFKLNDYRKLKNEHELLEKTIAEIKTLYEEFFEEKYK